MTLGRRCDEIIRLIDEMLVSTGTDPGAVVDVRAHPSGASLVDGDDARNDPGIDR